ncbi:MAG: hypothetical protein V4714_16410 [Bacteroidota bacterium]
MNPTFAIQMFKTVCITVILSVACVLQGYGQQEYTDYVGSSLLFSGSNLSGTARYQGIGGAQTALGADMGSLSGNPAGLGMFKKSEFSLTSALGYAGTNTLYIDNTTSDGKLNFNIPNIGLVFSGAKSDISAGKWRGGSFGIGFTRHNSFQNKYSTDGVNQVSSILDAFTYDANRRGATVTTLQNEYEYDAITDQGITSSSDDGGATAMYYNAYLINPYHPSNNPNDTIGNQGGLYNTTYFQFEGPQFDDQGQVTSPRSYAHQQKTFETSGARSQWNISYGGNFDDRLYFGATLGIESLRYTFVNKFDETYFSDNNPYGKAYRGISLNQELTTKGTGVNLNVGVIFRVNDVLRLGASALTPTFYNISESYNSSVDVAPSSIPDLDYNGYPTKSTYSPPTTPFTVSTAPRTFDYKLITPWRLSAGAAFFLGKHGFISGDVEYVTYDNIKLNGGDATFKSDYQKGIKDQYQSVFNYKIGLELRHNIFRFRSGFGYQADPYQDKKTNNVDRSRLTGSIGAGVRLPKFYVDAAATYSQYKSANTPYVLPDNSRYASSLTTNSLTNVVITFGTFF